MAQHRPRKPAPVEYSTDEEDIIVYDVEENEFESNPDYEHLDFVKENLGCAATPPAKDVMNDTALEVKSITKCFKLSVEECGISVDGRDTWTFIAKCGFYRNFIH
ncbi:hypothetical protein TNCV_759821 [Trichonephila clavipes]|nr:hypothetical protein TNCV_759821 [Trichonephila clavipes]